MVDLEQMKRDLMDFGSGWTLEEMPRNTLEDKLQNGPTAAHRIEELHTPANYAYVTCTTGSSAFQNLVGVTWQELSAREEAGRLALERLGAERGTKLLVSYPPLISVFSRQAIDRVGVDVSFIQRPSRDALLVGLASGRPQIVIGESRFLRAALVDGKRLGLLEQLPRGLKIVAAGSPMDPELCQTAQELLSDAEVHDLYGCQEFGWLCLDGVPLRRDVTLWNGGRTDGRSYLLVGGLPVGDCFLTGKGNDGSVCIRTDSCERAGTDLETWICAASADRETLQRTARTILRCKGKIVRVSGDCVCGGGTTRLRICVPGEEESLELSGPEATAMFDDLLEAQKAYQREDRTDPVWNKKG